METDALITNNKLVWRPVTVPGLIRAYVAVPTVEAIPTFDWTGPKIPLALWRSILSFFKWSQDTHHCETQVRLFLNTATGQWRAWAFPQEKGGMTTKEIPGKDADEQRANLGGGYQEFGSVHHHCSAGAFQSGTDHSDESGRPGLHITVGNMDSKSYSLHTRSVFIHNGHKAMYTEMDLDQWFEAPPWFTGLAPEVVEMLGKEAEANAIKRALTTPSTDPFPEIWKANLIERKYTYSGIPDYLGHGYKPTGPNGFFDGVGGGGLHPGESDKKAFLEGILDIMDQFNMNEDEMWAVFDAMQQVRQLVLVTPRVGFDDAEKIIADAIKSGELERLSAERELEILVKGDKKDLTTKDKAIPGQEQYAHDPGYVID